MWGLFVARYGHSSGVVLADVFPTSSLGTSVGVLVDGDVVLRDGDGVFVCSNTAGKSAGAVFGVFKN